MAVFAKHTLDAEHMEVAVAHSWPTVQAVIAVPQRHPAAGAAIVATQAVAVVVVAGLGIGSGSQSPYPMEA